MDRLYSSSKEILSKLFEHLSEWKTKKRDPLKFRWSDFHLSVIRSYVLKLKIIPHSSLLSPDSLLNQELSDEKVSSFMHALHEVFIVPQQHQLFERDAAIKKTGLMAAFIDMLLRLLHDWPASVNSMEGQDRLASLKKGLTFLLAVLGDESFIYNVQDLWPEFEAVANEAGIVVYLIVFSSEVCPVSERFFCALLRDIDDLQVKIINVSNQQQVIDDTWIIRNTAAADSLFIVDSLVHDLEDILNREDDKVVDDVKDQIKTLQRELNLWNSLIKNQEIEELKEYLVKIRDVVFEAEYLINYFLYGDDAPHSHSHRYLSIRLSHVIRKIKSIKSQIRESKKNIDNTDVQRFAQLSLQNKCITELGDVIGLEDKEMEILQYLDGGKEDLQIISIVGMPGLGKTTLARKLYDHPSLKRKFDAWSWCVVSQHFEKKNLLIDILSTLKDVFDKEEMLNLPQESLTTMIHQYLYKRRFFIILDDLWSSDAWFDLRFCFPNNENGSRILLTSRNRNVAPTGSIICKLPPMSDEHCWQLLRKKVFQNEPCPPELLDLGQKIAKNCRGLPLAVVVTAGILSSKDTKESTWKEVAGNLSSYILSDESNLMMQIVELSYNNPPDHLKPCFLYFGVYPKRMPFTSGLLLALWIAEGFVRGEDKKRAYRVAEEYLGELIDRSLATVLKIRFDGRVKACSVHDLLHEFCMKRCQEENLKILVDKNYSLLNEKHQRFCILSSVSSPRFPLFGLHVRSITGCFPRSGFLNMKLLRVLVLERFCYDSLNEIKVLVNLRCLYIGYGSSSSKLEELKLAFICSLINLELLKVRSQFYLVYTPSEMAKMIKLRHIAVDTEVRFGEESITTNNILEILGKVTIRELKDEQMLRCSPHLRDLQCKCFPLVVKETRELRYPDFSFFTQLELLAVEAGLVNTVMDISFPMNVKELYLTGVHLPMEKISVIGRLQNLKLLKLQFGASVGEVWETKDGEFKQLRWLALKSVNDLREWRVESSSHFPRLEWLVLDDCRHLQDFPAAVGEIETLEEVQIKGQCQETLVESVREIEQQLEEDGNEVLKFYIH